MNTKLLLCLLVLWSPVGNALQRAEFRIPLPYTLEQYKIGHPYAVSKASILETGGGEGVEVIANEPFESEELGAGQYTHKIYHLASKLPRLIRMLAPRGSVEVEEKSWNVFPYVKTTITSPQFMRDTFRVRIESRYVEDDDCQRDDIFNGPRGVVHIDIVNDEVTSADYREDEDPTKCHSQKLDLGPLTPNWKTKKPHMCVYNLVEAEFMWWGLQRTIERRLLKFSQRYFQNLHRQMFCWADEWADLSMAQIRELEEETKERLDEIRNIGDVRGT